MAGIETTPRIYVADLAAPVGGELHGAWIDATQDADDIREQIAAMLHPGNEEWAIHDYDNFLGLNLDEYEPIERVAMLAQLVDEHGEAFTIWYANDPYSLKEMDADELASDFGEAYQGVYADLADYAEEVYSSLYNLDKELPEPFRNYIDWEALGRDLDLGGDVWTGESSGGRIYVYRSV